MGYSYLATREEAWYIISVYSVRLSVCRTITFESLNVGSSYLQIRYISPCNTCQVHIWRSLGPGHGHTSKQEAPQWRRAQRVRRCRSGLAYTALIIGNLREYRRIFIYHWKLDSLGYISLAECIGVFSTTFT